MPLLTLLAVTYGEEKTLPFEGLASAVLESGLHDVRTSRTNLE